MGEAIRSERGKARLSQGELARLVGVSRTSVSDWERGAAEPTSENVARMAEIFGVSPAAIRYPGGSPGYGLSQADIARVPGLSDVLLQMPEHVHALIWPFLGELARAGVSTDARERVEVLATQLSTGHFTPGYRTKSEADEEADARDLIALVRRLYQRRGVAVGSTRSAAPDAAVTVSVPVVGFTDDPDAVPGKEAERQLAAKKGGKKAG